MMKHAVLRPASVSDAEQVAAVYLASRAAFLAFAPVVHSAAEVRDWVASVLIPGGGVTVAVGRGSIGPIVGMMSVSRQHGVGWIDQLYLLPSAVGHGLGTQLVEHAKKSLCSPIRLFTFQENVGARRFYERHGFRAIELSDGSNNEEHCPDILYEWVATEPHLLRG
jgi:ribosomal protein S18 acetylase RimI-like enzyme